MQRLLDYGARVTVADNFSSGAKDNLPEHCGLDIIEVDLTSPKAVELLGRCCSKVDYLVHLAANASVTESILRPTSTHRANGAMSINMFEWAGKTHVSNVVYASSAAVYGEPKKLPVRESDLPSPLSPYAIDKLASEQYLMFFSRAYGFTAFPLRFMNVYGPRQSHSYSGVLTKFLEKIDEGKNPVVFGDGTQTRDFVHVDDVVESIIAALPSNISPKTPINIGSGVPTSLNDVLAILHEWFEFEPIYLDYRPGEVRDSYADTSLAKVLLNWRSTVNLRDGLRTLVDDLKMPGGLRLSLSTADSKPY